MNRIKLFALTAAMALPAAGVMFASAAPINLVKNGTFDNDVAGWDNFGGNPTFYKHTMQITNSYAGAGGSYYSGWYCVKVKAGTEYVTEADYWVPDSAPENSGASLQLHYYASNDCSGGNMTSGGEYREGGKLPGQRGDWEHFKFKDVAPDGAKSVRVRASAIKEPAGGGSIPGPHVVYFDNVSFVEQLKIVLPTATATPKGPDDVVSNPTPTQPPSNPGDVVSNPDPTQPPSNPDDLNAEPDPTEPPSNPGDVTSNSDPTSTPAPPNTGDSNPGGQNGGNQNNGSQNGGKQIDVIPQGQPGGQNAQHGNGGNTANGDIHPAAQEDGGSVGLGIGLLFIGAGGVCAALGLSLAALAKRRRRDA